MEQKRSTKRYIEIIFSLCICLKYLCLIQVLIAVTNHDGGHTWRLISMERELQMTKGKRELPGIKEVLPI